MNARVIYVDMTAGVEEIELGSHSIELSGFGGEGYCHAHQSSDCYEQLSDEELDALAATQLCAA